MNILRKYQLLETLIGLNPIGGRAKTSVQIFYSVVFILLFSTEVTYFFVNIHIGIGRAAAVLPPIGGVIPEIATYAYLMINRERYYSLIKGMRDIVVGSMSETITIPQIICW